MREAELRSGERFVLCVGVAVALLGCGYASVCIAGRLGSPWPLEWMEGASAWHAQRLLRGLPLYAAPRADFIPFVYPPLSYLPMGLGLWVSGGALWGARLASVLALALGCAALWRAGTHLSGRSGPGLLAAGLFAMGYGYTGGFIDLARVDAWFCALSLCGVERLCARRCTQGLLLLALACLAKQHAVLLLAAASGGVLFVHGRAGVRGMVLSWLGLALCVAVLCVLSEGWIWTYCITVPARHGIEPRLLLSFVAVDLCLYLPVLSALCVAHVWTRRDSGSRLLCLLLLAAVVASALGRAHPGGDDNVRLPAYALAVLVAAVSFNGLLLERPRLCWPLAGALALQLAMLFQSPTLYWPALQTAERFERLRAQLAGCAGSQAFAAMDHVGLGAHPFVHTLALSDLRMNRDELAQRATDVVLSALREPASAELRGDSSPSLVPRSEERGEARAALDAVANEAGPTARAGAEAPGAAPANRPHDARSQAVAPAAFAISTAFPELMQTLAAHYELCARAPELAMPTGYSLPPTYIYRHLGSRR